jgi:hypothetical protein
MRCCIKTMKCGTDEPRFSRHLEKRMSERIKEESLAFAALS